MEIPSPLLNERSVVRVVLFWAALAGLPLCAQIAKTGDAKSTAPCSISNTGSNNQIVITGCHGLPLSTKKQITKILNDQAKDRAELLDKMNELLGRFNQVSQYFEKGDQEENLRKQFPSGYVIFDIDRTNSVFPYPSHDLDAYRIDWSQMAILENDSSKLWLRFPSIYDTEHHNSISGLQAEWERPVANRPKTLVVLGCFRLGAEILSIQPSGTVFVIGFSANQCPPIPPAHF